MKVLVIGNGMSGKSVCKLLKKQGHRTFLFDDKKYVPKFILLKLFENLDLVIVSPGVSLDNDLVITAKKKNIEVVGELEYSCRFFTASIVAITGTNGKTTTTKLVEQLLSDYKTLYVGGNIGIPVSSFAQKIENQDRVVLEVSSFQLETIKNFKPKVSCLLNISEDHLNRHKTMQNYVSAKMRIFENQNNTDFAVLNLDQVLITNLDLSFIKSQIYYFSTKFVCKGCYSKNGCIYFNDGNKSTFIMKTSAIPLAGEHNLYNVLAALLCVILLGETDFEKLKNKIIKFHGVSHRLEFVTEINGVNFINDSKATNIDSAIVAMKAMNEPTTIIVGGSDKGFEYDTLFENLQKNIKAFIVIGQTKQKIIDSAIKKGVSNIYEAQNLREAVFLAYQLSNKGENVLLSPACASFDMFKNFEQRGKVFCKIVRELEKSENRKIPNKKNKENKI